MKLLSKRHLGNVRISATLTGDTVMLDVDLLNARLRKTIETAMLTGKFPPAKPRPKPVEWHSGASADMTIEQFQDMCKPPQWLKDMAARQLKPLTEQQKVDFINGPFTYELPFGGHAIHTGEKK